MTARKRAAADGASAAVVDIQPLRDLARNFDLDIEPYLEEYLRLTEELEEGDGGWDDGAEGVTAQQFAAAALKIQNSVGIYNRKVDFLHQVAYAVLNDFLHSQLSSRSKKKRPSNRGADPEIEAFDDFDPDLEFLPLDDVLPTDRTEGRRRINLREEEGRGGSDAARANLDRTSVPGGATRGGNDASGTPDVTMISLGGVLSASRTMDQNGTFVVHRQSLDGSSPRAMSRMLLANLQGGRAGGVGNGGDGEGNLRLRAGMCDVGPDGALLMPGTRASVFVNGERAANRGAEEEEVRIFPGGLSPGPRADADATDFGAADDDEGSFGNGGDDWGGEDAGGVGFELNDAPMDGGPGDDFGGGEEKKDETEAEATTAPDQKKPQPKKKAIEDPWAVLDPHEPSHETPKPLKVGVTYRLPPELDQDDRPSAAVTGSSTRTRKASEAKGADAAARPARGDFFRPPFACLEMFDGALPEGDADESAESIQREPRHLILLNKLRRKELIFGEEFVYIQKAHAKYNRALRRQRAQRGDPKEAGPTEADAMLDVDDDHDDYGGGFDFGGGDDDGSFGHRDAGDDDGPRGPLHRSNVDFDDVDDVFGGGGGFDETDFRDDDGLAKGAHPTFEELCRAHLRKFARTAEAYASETSLARRVGAWQEGLRPRLEEQEGRSEFDIHGCGRRILKTVERQLSVRKRTSTGEKKLEASLGGAGNVVDFASIVSRECEDYEVCRLFLSTLMLCNCGNVALHAGGEGEAVESAESLGIELLDAEFQPPMEAYVAPSAEDWGEGAAALPSIGMVDENAPAFDG